MRWTKPWGQVTLEREYKIDDVIQTKSPQFFHVMTGITKDDFVRLCDMGFMKKPALNRIVRDLSNQETSSLEPEKYILENLKKMAS